MEFEQSILQEKINDVTSSEGRLRAEVLNLKNENTKLQQLILDIREKSRIESREILKNHYSELIGLADLLEIDLMNLSRFVRDKNIPERFSEAISSVINSGNRLASTIGKNINNKDF